MVTEYEPVDGGPDLRLELRSDNEGGTVELDAEVRDDNDLSLSLDFDVGRSLRSETAYTALVHRLGFRNLDHFAAVTDHGRVTRHTDMDPGRKYAIDYTLLEHRTEFQPKGMDNLTLAVGYRQQEREGMRQQTNISHCDSCHVINQARPIDESTTDARLEAQLAWDGGQVTASLVNREYSDDAAAISLLYDDALHPELRAPVFDNRLQYDSAEGPQRVGLQPDIDKEILEIDGSFDDVGGFALTAGGAWSTTENRFTGYEASYSGAVVSAARPFKSWNLAFRGRSYSLDNDDVFVDAVERLGIAGPQAGKTYREIYGFDPDYLRQSSLDRQVLESNLDLSPAARRQARAAAALLGLHDDRPRQLRGGAGRDQEHHQRPRRLLAGAAEEGLEDTARLQARRDRQAVHERRRRLLHPDLCLVAKPVPAPGSAVLRIPRRPHRRHRRLRPAPGTSSRRAPATRPASNTLSASYRCWDGDNNDGDLTDWSRTVQAATIAFWSAPAAQWDWHLAYTWNQTELDLPASIPLFDG